MNTTCSDFSGFKYRVAVLGSPACPDVLWTLENLKKLKELGFNTIQLNLAWGGRPMDEALNLEDVVSLPDVRIKELNQPELPPRSVPERREERRHQLHERMRLAKEFDFRTIFHFGAPYNAQYSGLDFEGPQARSLLDPETTTYYEELLAVFAQEYNEVDDILVYTFDQDAWLTSEFGTCARTRGIPLHERVVPFIEALAKAWRVIHPDGVLWWSPWELSAGQVYKCMQSITQAGLGMDLHSCVGEVVTTMPVDRWFKNTVKLAGQRGIPVMCEAFLGAVCEETEPFQNLAYPPLTIRQVKSIASVPGITALKEYYGLNPTKPDPNLESASLAMLNHEMAEEEILQKVSGSNENLIRFWLNVSQALEFFPWDISWWIRCLGLADVSHSLSAATIRGISCATPSWRSTRAATFIKTDDAEPHPWLLEDVQLRCEEAVTLLEKAIETGADIVPAVTLLDTEMLKEKIFSYACHLRETNLAKVMRDFLTEGAEIPARILSEMGSVMEADLKNQMAVMARIPLPLNGAAWVWVPGKGSDEWNPFAPCDFSFEFNLRSDLDLKNALFCCVSSENMVRVKVNGGLLERFGSGVPPYFTRLNLQEGTNRIDVRVGRAGSLYTREAFCARMALHYADGTEELFDTGSGWKAGSESAEAIGRFNLDQYSHREWSAENPPSLVFTGSCRQGDGGAELDKALKLFRKAVPQFLNTYFNSAEDHRSRGHFSITSC